MSILVRIFNTKVICFLFVCWLVGFMICQFLLGYLIPKSPFLFVCWLVGFMICQLLLGYLIPKSTLFLFVCWLVGFMICQLLLGYLIPKSSFSVCVLVCWFIDMSTLVRIFNTKVFSFLFLCSLVRFMICQFLLGYLIPKSSFFVCVFVSSFYDMSILVGYLIPKSSFLFVCWLVGFMMCQFLLGYLTPKSSLFCLCVGWLVL